MSGCCEVQRECLASHTPGTKKVLNTQKLLLFVFLIIRLMAGEVMG